MTTAQVDQGNVATDGHLLLVLLLQLKGLLQVLANSGGQRDSAMMFREQGANFTERK